MQNTEYSTLRRNLPFTVSGIKKPHGIDGIDLASFTFLEDTSTYDATTLLRFSINPEMITEQRPSAKDALQKPP